VLACVTATDIDNDSVALLVNVLYLKASWLKTFTMLKVFAQIYLEIFVGF
jgi:hypothetical protein